MGYIDSSGGRKHRRLPIVIVVRLGHAESPASAGEERTFTDNISAHGARVVSKCPWQPGTEVEVTSVRDGSAIRGSVVYCESEAAGRFSIGLDFGVQEVPWSTYKKFNGV